MDNATQTLQMLQEIAHNTSRDPSVWIAIVSGVAALIGAAIGSVGGYFAATRTALSQEKIEGARLRGDLITAERLRWLRELRQRLSQLYAELDMQFSLIQRPVREGAEAAIQAEHDSISRKVMEQANMITLMLNPAKDHQETLRRSIREVQAFMAVAFANYGRTAQPANNTYTNLKTAAFSALTQIGVDAWTKIKAESGVDLPV